MKTGRSAFIQRLMQHGLLDDVARARIGTLESQAKTLSKRAVLFSPQTGGKRLAIINAGWVAGRVQISRAKSAVTQIFMPGDIVGLADLAFDRPTQTYTMQCDGTVSYMNADAYFDLIATDPDLFRRMRVMESVNQTALIDRMLAVAKHSAEDRLIHFMLNVKARTDQIHEQDSDRFPIHLSQKEIGDLLGLTDIYVNRLIRKMQKDGEIEISRPYFHITNPDKWAARVGFVNRFAKPVTGQERISA